MTDERLKEICKAGNLHPSNKIMAIVRKIVSATKEEDARICEEKHDHWRWDDETDSASGPRECAAAIRASK